MKTVGICGHFGLEKNLLNGQTIKTKSVTEEIIRQLGSEQVMRVDTHGGAKAMPKMLWQSFRMFSQCRNVVFFPAYKGLRVFTPVYTLYNLFFHRRIHYVVIGGWLDSFIEKHPWLTGMLKRFTGIYVETSTMKKALEKRGFDNIVVMPNFKALTLMNNDELVYPAGDPYPLCTFSRVMKEKGIEDAVESIRSINEQQHRTVFTLDIYGPVVSGQEDWFEQLKQGFPPYVQYRGSIPYDKSVETLKGYFALLFPTHFFTEGLPGTIIDGYASGVPVIASRWESFEDLVEEGKTGIGYTFADAEALKDVLRTVAAKPEQLLDMKMACLKASRSYEGACAIQALLRRFDTE